MLKRFKDLEIGESFHNGKSYGMGIKKNVLSWIVYIKVDKSTGKAVKQVGYGDNRAISGYYKFAANAGAIPCNEEGV